MSDEKNLHRKSQILLPRIPLVPPVQPVQKADIEKLLNAVEQLGERTQKELLPLKEQMESHSAILQEQHGSLDTLRVSIDNLGTTIKQQDHELQILKQKQQNTEEKLESIIVALGQVERDVADIQQSFIGQKIVVDAPEPEQEQYRQAAKFIVKYNNSLDTRYLQKAYDLLNPLFKPETQNPVFASAIANNLAMIFYHLYEGKQGDGLEKALFYAREVRRLLEVELPIEETADVDREILMNQDFIWEKSVETRTF